MGFGPGLTTSLKSVFDACRPRTRSLAARDVGLDGQYMVRNLPCTRGSGSLGQALHGPGRAENYPTVCHESSGQGTRSRQIRPRQARAACSIPWTNACLPSE